MRSLYNIERSAVKPGTYNFTAITSTLFFSQPPVVTCYPFRSFKRTVDKHYPVYLNKFPIKIQLFSFLQSNLPIFTILQTTTKMIGSTSMENQEVNFKNLPVWMLLLIFNAYIIEMEKWRTYLLDNIEEYCKESKYSAMQFSILKNVDIFSSPFTYEQMLWIYTSNQLEKVENFKLINDVRESILPWLNPEMWKKYSSVKENKRENVDYYKKKKEFLTSK